MGGGGKSGGGGTGIDAEITSTSTVDILGLDDVQLTLNVPKEIATKSTNVISVPEEIATKSTNVISVPDTIKTQSTNRNEIAVTEPIRTQADSTIGLDVRPLVMDLCFKVEFGRPPPTCIRKPYHHHFGITLFGMEVLGFNFSGESRTIIGELPHTPQVVWGGEQPVSPPGGKRPKPHTEPGGDVRIRVGT
jgi:hypothetical protein